MSYVKKSLVPGETLLYDTRHHWMVLIGPLLLSLLLVALGLGCLTELVEARNGAGYVADAPVTKQHMIGVAGIVLVVIAIGVFAWGLVLIKTGLGSRRTLDLMLSRVESIGVEESFWGRMLGYGSVTVRGTGGTPESFVMISHPQEFRRSVQAQIGSPAQVVAGAPVPPAAPPA